MTITPLMDADQAELNILNGPSTAFSRCRHRWEGRPVRVKTRGRRQCMHNPCANGCGMVTEYFFHNRKKVARVMLPLEGYMNVKGYFSDPNTSVIAELLAQSNEVMSDLRWRPGDGLP